MKISHVRKRSTATHLQKVDCMTMKLQLSSFHFIKPESIGLGYQLFLNNKNFTPQVSGENKNNATRTSWGLQHCKLVFIFTHCCRCTRWFWLPLWSVATHVGAVIVCSLKNCDSLVHGRSMGRELDQNLIFEFSSHADVCSNIRVLRLL